MENFIKITANQEIGDIGEKYVALELAKMNFIDVSKTSNDFGEDVLCDIFNIDLNTRTNYSVRFQVKSSKKNSKKPQIKLCKEGYYISIENRYLKQWEDMYSPVFIAIYIEEEDKAYWCYPPEQKENFNVNAKTQKIIVSKNNVLNLSTYTLLFEKIEKYYESMLKLNSFEYYCQIYPVIMPDYKFITGFELINNGQIPQYNDNELLPSFLTAYESLSPDGRIPFFEFSKKKSSYYDYYVDLTIYLNSLKIKIPNDRWLGFIISPIKYEEQDRKFNLEITGWQGLSLLNDKIVIDYNFTFDLNEKFVKTYKTRSSSANESYFITQNGKIAGVIYGSIKATYNQEREESIMSSFVRKSLLPWDISELSEEQVTALKKWLIEKNKCLTKYEDSTDIGIISNGNYNMLGSAGELMLLPRSMEEYINDDCSNQLFISQIPLGKKLSNSVINELEIFAKEKLSISEQLNVEKDDWVDYALYNHKNRYICFVLAYQDNKNNGIEKFKTAVSINEYIPDCEFDINWFENNKYDVTITISINSFLSTNDEIEKYMDKIENINKKLEENYQNITETLICGYYMRGRN